MKEIKSHKFPGVYSVTERGRSSLATKSLVPKQRVYGEKIAEKDGVSYRLWSARRSKLAAAIKKGLSEMPIQPGSRVLYLGAASGTTVSHVSDIVGPKGLVFAVEFSPRIARDLLRLADSRPNIIPIVEDVRHPTRYASLVSGHIDVVYQDVAQTDQARILYDNLRTYCFYGAWGLLAIKARSIDSSANVEKIYRQEISTLRDFGVNIVEEVKLDPLEKDHIMVVGRVSEDIA